MRTFQNWIEQNVENGAIDARVATDIASSNSNINKVANLATTEPNNKSITKNSFKIAAKGLNDAKVRNSINPNKVSLGAVAAQVAQTAGQKIDLNNPTSMMSKR